MTQDLLEKPQAGQHPVLPCTHAGVILGLQGDVLHGWAMNTAQPDQRLIVEVIIDGAPVALARADQYEPVAPMGDQFHGFTVQLRQSWLDEAAVIAVRIANDGFELDGNVLLPAGPPDSSHAIAAQVWHTGGLRLSGWCWDPQSPRRHVEVTVSEGNVVIASATCNSHNQALAYRATSDHGFSIDLPWELADGMVHKLELTDDRGQQLAGSPISVCCWPEGVTGLLQSLEVESDPALISLLTDVANEHTVLLPKSAGWHLYPSWFEAFQRLDSLPAVEMQGRVGVVLISDGNCAHEQLTLDSLGQDRGLVHEIAITPAEDLMPAVDKVLTAGCDFILPLIAGDRLAPSALGHLCALLDGNNAWAYGDCDQDSPTGERTHPWLKPIWDIDLFIGADVFTPGAIFSAPFIAQALSLLPDRVKHSAVNWHDLTAAIALATEQNKVPVAHLPRVLYHRSTCAPESPEQAEPSAHRRLAVEWLCESLATGTTVSSVEHYPALLRPLWPLPQQLPRVSLIVPTRDQFRLLHTCIEGLLNETDYPDLEIIVVDNQSSDPQTLAYFEDLKKRGVAVVSHPHPFNYSTINNVGVSHATGDLIGLVNNDIEIVEGGWLKEMVSHALRPDVGVVGAKLLWPNHMVQHAGVVVGINGLAAHTGNLLNDQDPGYLAFNHLTREQSAVTAACLLISKSLYQAVQGLDELAFPVAFNDVDLCLKVKATGKRIIWSSKAKLIHAESASRGKDLTPEKKARALREQKNFIERWVSTQGGDPHYHPSLSLDYLSGAYGGLALPPRPPVTR